MITLKSTNVTDSALGSARRADGGGMPESSMSVASGRA